MGNDPEAFQLRVKVRNHCNCSRRSDMNSGKDVIPAIYKKVWDFNEGLAAVADAEHKVEFIDKTGKDDGCRLQVRILFIRKWNSGFGDS